MSRSGFHEAEYYDRDEILAMGRTVARIKSATRGKRGQKFLKMALKALDQMEDKRLAANTFGVGAGGCMCFMSSIATETGRATLLDNEHSNDWDGQGTCERLADGFDVASVLVQDLVWDNDENAPLDPSDRWQYMRDRVARSIQKMELKVEHES